MKRVFRGAIVLLIALAMIGLFAACNHSGDTPSDDIAPSIPSNPSKFLYESDGQTITITGYSGIESTVTIPAAIDGLPVKAVAENAFREFTYLNKIYLPDSIETIDYAFVSCPDLTYVRLGSGIVSMNGAFRNCTKLTTVEGDFTAQYMDEAFYGCVSLTRGTIPEGAVSAVSAYASCTSLAEVTVGEGITTLKSTFKDCISLKSAALPTSLTEASNTFSGCTSLREVTGGDSLAIMERTFEQCPLLTAFTISEHLSIMKGAFVGCTSLRELNGMSDRLSVYTASFTGCRSLTSLLIPHIEDADALSDYNLIDDVRGCEQLKTVVVLAEYEVREEFCKVFAGCSFLESVELTDSVAIAMLRLSYTITDTVFDGTNKTLAAAVKKWKKASAARETKGYGAVDGVPYTHIYGGDVDTFDMDKLIAKTDLLAFEPFEKVSYWCGYPEEGNRKDDTVGIKRTFTFSLRTTGKNDGTLPETLTLNGLSCAVGE